MTYKQKAAIKRRRNLVKEISRNYSSFQDCGVKPMYHDFVLQRLGRSNYKYYNSALLDNLALRAAQRA